LNDNEKGGKMRTVTRRLGVIGLTLLVCLLVVSMVFGCAKPTPAPTPTPGPAPTPTESPVAVKEWNLPMLTILTGPIAFAGIPAGWGAQYAVDEINASGGIRGVPIKFSLLDTAFDPAKAVQAYSQAIPGSLVVIGPLDGVGAAAGSQSIKEAKIANITDASDEAMREMMAPYGVSYFQDNGKAMQVISLKWIEMNPYIKSVAVFYMPPQPTSQTTFEAVQKTLTAAGHKVVPVEFMPTETDFGPTVVKAINSKVEGYICLALEPHYIAIGKELYNRGVTEGTGLLGTFACTGPELFTVGKGFLEGAYCQENGNPVDPNPKWQAIMAAYDKEFPGQVPPATVLEFYDSVYLVKEAIETLKLTGDPKKLDEERAAMAKYLYNTPEIQGLQYPYKIVNGDKIAPNFLLQIKNNAYTLAATVNPQ
jgi:branched-chain amino acid transport system substrate-binding protein